LERTNNRNFLHFAVQSQIWSYLTRALTEPIDTRIKQSLDSLLYVAVNQPHPLPLSERDWDRCALQAVEYALPCKPHLEIVGLLLKRGANPNHVFANAPRNDSGGTPVIFQPGRYSTVGIGRNLEDFIPICTVFLEYGAYPKVWLAQRHAQDGGHVSELARWKGREAKSIRKRGEAKATRKREEALSFARVKSLFGYK